MSRCPACRRPVAGAAACPCGWRPAALRARTEADPLAWKQEVRASIARHRQRREQLTGAAQPPQHLSSPPLPNVIPFQATAATAPAPAAGAPSLHLRPAPPAIPVTARPFSSPPQAAAARAFAPAPAAPVLASTLLAAASPARPTVAFAPAPLLPADPEPAPRAAVEFTAPGDDFVPVESPLAAVAAPLTIRAAAALVDTACAMLAAVGFSFGVHATARMAGGSVPAQLGWLLAAACGVIAFAALQWLCLSRQLPTPGMRTWGLTLRQANGQTATPSQWRRRAGASLLSLGALGLGYFWVYLDEGRLSWHDRISGTALAARPRDPRR